MREFKKNVCRFIEGNKKVIGLTLIVLLIFFSAAIIYSNREIKKSTEGRIYSRIETIPYNKVGLLLGTGKYLNSGRENPYYTNRIKATIDLLEQNKIKYVVISGDNSRQSYNEPEMMREDLIRAGVDSTTIFLDYAGFRTFDSVVRLKEIFGQTSVTIISQQFHNERAIFIASKEGISAIGYNAKDVGKVFGFKVQMREKLARVKVFVDFLIGQEPKFLGEKISIP